MANINPAELAAAIAAGTLVPCLGPGALDGVVDTRSGSAIPADGESLILAMNGGRPMAPKLMWEFSRAAMNVELKRGRKAVQSFLDRTYGETRWTESELHLQLARLRPPYLIDLNRDRLLQDAYTGTAHTLVRGFARLGGSDYRFKVFHNDGQAYREIEQTEIDPRLPILFKPLGGPGTGASYIASDADYVDYLTELMGGFAIPDPVKRHRIGLQYLMIGARFNRDTERMLVGDLIYGASQPGGWAMIKEPSRQERKFCDRHHLEIIDAGVEELLAAMCALVPEPQAFETGAGLAAD